MKKIVHLKIVIASFISLLAFQVIAQQDVMLTQYSSSIQLINPAYVGTSGRLNAMGIIRNQWVGFEGAPRSQVIMVNSPFLRYHLGVGITLLRDQIGPNKLTLFYANVAYNLNLTSTIKISMGLSGGFNTKKLDANLLDPIALSDPAYNLTSQMDFLPNFGAGIYIYSERFYFGFSTPKLLQNSYKSSTPNISSTGDVRHYFIVGGYLIDMNEQWKAKPSFSMKMVKGSPLSFDITGNLIYNDKVWFGLMYRFKDAVGFIVKYQFSERFRIGYSYDLPVTQMLKNTAGSHEISLSYDLVFKDNKIVTPRYF